MSFVLEFTSYTYSGIYGPFAEAGDADTFANTLAAKDSPNFSSWNIFPLRDPEADYDPTVPVSPHDPNEEDPEDPANNGDPGELPVPVDPNAPAVPTNTAD